MFGAAVVLVTTALAPAHVPLGASLGEGAVAGVGVGDGDGASALPGIIGIEVQGALHDDGLLRAGRDRVTLVGHAPFDDVHAWLWEIVEQPAESRVALAAPGASSVALAFDKPGVWRVHVVAVERASTRADPAASHAGLLLVRAEGEVAFEVRPLADTPPPSSSSSSSSSHGLPMPDAIARVPSRRAAPLEVGIGSAAGCCLPAVFGAGCAVTAAYVPGTLGAELLVGSLAAVGPSTTLGALLGAVLGSAYAGDAAAVSPGVVVGPIVEVIGVTLAVLPLLGARGTQAQVQLPLAVSLVALGGPVTVAFATVPEIVRARQEQRDE